MFLKIFIRIIKIYQAYISPLTRPSCRFYPSCSTYALEALIKYKMCKGGMISLKRILKCHPFHPGGFDPLI